MTHPEALRVLCRSIDPSAQVAAVALVYERKEIREISDKRLFIFMHPDDPHSMFAKIANVWEDRTIDGKVQRVLDNCTIRRVAYYDTHEKAWIADLNGGDQNCNPYAIGRVPVG